MNIDMQKILLVVLSLALITGCTTATGDEMGAKDGNTDGNTGGDMDENTDVKNGEMSDDPTDDWKDIPLKDVKNGETYKISDFSGEKVMIETFAIWCPVCNKQQKETKKLHEELGADVVSVALDIDKNEDEEKIREHMESNGFDWHFSVSPQDMTRKLVAEYGGTIISTGQAPIVMVCEDGSSRILGGGLKNTEKLQEELDKGCAL